LNSSNENTVACPLDCYDGCEAILIDEKIKGNSEHFTTKSKLCYNFARLLKEDYLEAAYINKEKTSLDSALKLLVEKLKQTDASKTLYYKGSGNLGVMQSSPKCFFEKYGSVFTKGSLCEGAGEKGLVLGRGKCVNPPLSNLLDSDVIICWGRNFSTTSHHMYSLVKDKIFITIDPIITAIAKKSELHLQINPKTDHELALLLTRFAYMEDMEDEEFIEEFGSGADWFFDLAKSRPLVSYEKTTGLSLSEITKFFELIKGKSVSLMLGLGVQKYYEGVNITRAIDSFAAYIGLHNKKKGGVWYLSDSAYGYENQFKVNPKKRVTLPEVDFDSYDLVFIQGANPLVSSPNTQKLIDGLKNCFVVYFGISLNDTCEYANIVIPSTNFKAKKDVRLSYGHELIAVSYEVEEKQKNSISEYDFTKYMFEQFDFTGLIDENEAFNYYVNTKREDASFIEKFEFLEELEVENLYEKKKEDEFYFLTSKRKDSLNSQFKENDYLYINSACSFKDGDKVLLMSPYGEADFIIKLDANIKNNCVVAYAGNKNANYITPHKSDEEAFSAIFQEVLVKIELS
jgi:anaerobic selenocysteine-containing dehydrogenase